ncbi:hypothetical protein HY638_06080 [Candidatus Woesearchaeota archaeon]|nr:hypothetical protein [Candidatus Woesearchaeota archaeon]
MKYDCKGNNGGVAYLAGVRPKEIGLISTSIKGSIGHEPEAKLLAHALANYIVFGPDEDGGSQKGLRERANEVLLCLALYRARDYARVGDGARVLGSVEYAVDFARAARREISPEDIGEVVEMLIQAQLSLRKSERLLRESKR